MVTITTCQHDKEVCGCVTGEDPSPQTREDRIQSEILKQAAIYRPGTGDDVLKRAAIRALIGRGEY